MPTKWSRVHTQVRVRRAADIDLDPTLSKLTHPFLHIRILLHQQTDDNSIQPKHAMDIPLFGDSPNKRRREINLGGTSTATSYNDILQEAKLRRLQRNDLKRRQDSATRIQHWWRGKMALRAVRQDLRRTFDQDITTLTGLRCLVLLGQDEDALGRWSTVVSSSRQGTYLAI